MWTTKKLWVWGVSVVAVAVVVTLVSWTEYGKGYSEDQRRNWNKMVSVIGKERKPVFDILIEKSWKDRREKSDVPVWNPDFSQASKNLPIEGMLRLELMNLAEIGNGDACLELVFREFYNHTTSSVFFQFPSFKCIYEIEKYLTKAVEAGRPGADFLLRLFEHRKQGGDDSHIKNVEGYQLFLSRLSDGDFFLGKIYLYLISSNEDDDLNRLDAGLEKRVRGGDLISLRNRGQLALLRCARSKPDDYWSSLLWYKSKTRVNRETNIVRECRDKAQIFLPRMNRFWEKAENSICTWIEVREWKSTRTELMPFVQMLKSAAELGDLHAKYLWNQYVVLISRYFSKSDWKIYLRNADDLLIAGGVYAEGLTYYNCFDDGFSCNESLECSFYEEKSVNNVASQVRERSRQEYLFCFPSEMNSKLIEMKVKSSCGMERFAGLFHAGERYFSQMSEELKQRSYEIIEKSGNEGDPYALFYLSKLWSDGKILAANPSKAWDAVERLKRWRESIVGSVVNDRIIHYELGEGQVASNEFRIPFDRAIKMQRWAIVSQYGDMPGLSVDQAFKEFCMYPRIDFCARPEKEMKEGLKKQFEKRGYKVPDEKKN